MRASAAGPGSQARGGGGPLQLRALAGAEPVLITVRFHCKESQPGSGAAAGWLPHKADLQKLQRYLFINSLNRHLVSLHSEQTQHPPQVLGSLGLSLSLHSIKGRAGGSPKNSASAVPIYIPFKVNKKLRFISPQKEAY